MTKNNFREAKFYTTVNDLNSLPNASIREVAIVGRSNAGKSSLLNTLTDQNKLAFTSKTPGRTQHINYFSIDGIGANGMFLVDLPGYGYAKVPEKIRTHWVQLLGDYLQSRSQLCGLVLIMDSRHPLRDLDYQMLQFFKTTGKTVHLVLSKADKLTHQEKIKTLQAVKAQLASDGYTNYSIQLFSAFKKTGVDELVTVLNSWLTPNI